MGTYTTTLEDMENMSSDYNEIPNVPRVETYMYNMTRPLVPRAALAGMRPLRAARPAPRRAAEPPPLRCEDFLKYYEACPQYRRLLETDVKPYVSVIVVLLIVVAMLLARCFTS
jgi:hypothetical protein